MKKLHKHPTLSKKVKRELQTDEAIRVYFWRLQRWTDEQASRRWRLARVEYYPKGEGPIQVLQVAKVWETDDGVTIIVR